MASQLKDVEQPKELDVSIDEYQLDREWVIQPELVYEWAVAAADARREMDAAKARLEVVKADLSLKMRSDPQSYGLPKTTDAAVTSAVTVADECVEAVNAYHVARHRYELIQAGLAALENRKKALENLVSLHLSNYYAQPQARKDDAEGVQEMQKRTVRGKGTRKGVCHE